MHKIKTYFYIALSSITNAWRWSAIIMEQLSICTHEEFRSTTCFEVVQCQSLSNRNTRECPGGQHGVPSVRLHWINTFFTHSTAGMSVPQSSLLAFLPCSLDMHAYSAIDTSCTVNPFGEILALYSSAAPVRVKALSVHQLQRQHTSANWKHFSIINFLYANICRVFLEMWPLRCSCALLENWTFE